MTTGARLRRAAVAVVAVVACADVLAGVTFLVRPSHVEHGTPSAEQPPAPSPRTSSPSPGPSPSPPPQRGAADTIWIPVQHVRAHIDVCDIVNDELEPPQDVHRTCYWAGGAHLSARTGTTVVTGHVNWVGQGTGALGNIGDLRRGNVVRTTGQDGIVTNWQVESVVHRPKSQGIDTSVFVGEQGVRRLYLITCGGAFDAADANYLDNVYVEATPLQGRPAATSPDTSGSQSADS